MEELEKKTIAFSAGAVGAIAVGSAAIGALPPVRISLARATSVSPSRSGSQVFVPSRSSINSVPEAVLVVLPAAGVKRTAFVGWSSWFRAR